MRYLFLLFTLYLSLEVAGQDDILTKGQKVPYFTILSDNGKKNDFSTFKNKVVLINFFATWCVPCVKELPILQSKVWNKYKNNPDFCLLVIGRGHTDSELKSFREKYNFNFPMYADPGKKIFSLFAKSNIPRNYIVGKDGKIAYLTMGYNEKEFEEMLKKLGKILK